MHLQLDPMENHCTNANKATKADQACSEAGNSAWNTHSTARTGKPADAQAPPYPDHKLHLQLDPVENHCTNANKATKADQACSEAGNSAWNTHSTARTGKPADAQAPPYPDHKLHLQLDPVENHCTNANKATKADQACSEAGNSAWNTHSTARTGKPADAQAPPYPDHKLHLQLAPLENHCTNANKATKEDQACSEAG